MATETQANTDDTLEQLLLRYPAIVVEEAPQPTLTYDVFGPRLIITKVEIQNFKSYGGNRTLGPFHKNFTCIIGANGSGKSNVIDSLLFVFGFRASKIRSKKLNVLIHKSELFPNVQECTVCVCFQRIVSMGDGDEDYEVVPNSDFTVSRTVTKENTSIFKINDRRVIAKEVSEFLKRQGIDLDHNRFLILQGEVEQIALMKPKAASEHEDGLLEYLEDIIGSRRFKIPLETLLKRLEELCDLRSEKLHRVKIVEKEKKELEGIRNEAVKYLKLCNEIVIRKSITFQLRLKESRSLESVASEKVAEAREELSKIQTEIDGISVVKAEKDEEIKKVEKELEKKNEEFMVAQEMFNKCDKEDARLRDIQKHLKEDLKKLEKSIKKNEEQVEEFKNVPAESEVKIKELNEEKDELDKVLLNENEALVKAQDMLKVESEGLQMERDKKDADVRQEQEKVRNQESAISSKKCELELLLGNFNTEEKKLKTMEVSLEQINKQIQTSEVVLENLLHKLPQMRREFDEVKEKLNVGMEKKEALEREIGDLSQKLEFSRSKETGQKTLDFIMEKQRQGAVKNVYGRLGSLASVDAKYDVAISTACFKLDFVLTGSMHDANECIGLLKQANAGRLTFMALDKQRDDGLNRPFQLPPKAVRAFDQLKFTDNAYRSALYAAIGDLLIVDNIMDAKEISRKYPKKYRIVTLKGDIVERAGAYTGGGNQQMSGKINTNTRQMANPSVMMTHEEQKRVQNLFDQKRHELHGLQQEIKSMHEMVDKLQENIASDQRAQQKASNDIVTLTARQKSLKSSISEQHSHLKKVIPEPKKVNELESSIKKLSDQYEKDSSKIKAMKTVVEKLTERIKEMGKQKIGSIQERINSVNEKLNKNSMTLKKVNKSVKLAEKMLQTSLEQLEQQRLEKQTKEQELKEADDKMKDLEANAQEILSRYKGATEEVNVLEKQRVELENKCLQFKDEIKKLNHVKIQVERDVREKHEKVVQIQNRMNQIREQIGKLKMFPIPEDCEEENDAFMDLIGEKNENLYSSQKDAFTGTVLKTYTDDELEVLDNEKISYQEMEEKLQRQKPNLAAIEEYRLKEETYMLRVAELNNVTNVRDTQKDQFDKLKQQRLNEFLAGFGLINQKLKEMYQMITMGGDAELELVDSLDPFSEGIVFSVRPPKKSWKNISNLSGGEKTLSSLSLVFALHHFKPTPFYVMDEIDAALDFKNVSIVANYIKDRTKNAQFIIISLRNNMYELCDRLIGIYKPFNFTKTTVINPKALEKYLTISAPSKTVENNVQKSQPFMQPQSSQQAIQPVKESENNIDPIEMN